MDSVKIYNFLSLLLISFGITHVSASCQNKYVINRGLTCSDKELILEMHNQLRQSVALGQVPGQPGASTMMLLSWDEELARKSQNLADSCHYGHDSNNARAVSRFYVGQNIATTWSTWEKTPEPDFSSQIKAWFDEVDTYSFSRGFSHKTGHYSQMVWADTYLIGCGYNYFYDGYRYQKIYVCNYGPGGNVQGRAPYSPGTPSCDEYGMISSTKYYGLCDSYRSFYPDYTCYRYRRSAAVSESENPKQIVSNSNEIVRIHNLAEKSKKLAKAETKKHSKEETKLPTKEETKKHTKEETKLHTKGETKKHSIEETKLHTKEETKKHTKEETKNHTKEETKDTSRKAKSTSKVNKKPAKETKH